MGWNVSPGGFGDARGLRGVPKSPKTRAKMRAAALARYCKPGEKERTAKAVRKAFRNIDRSGPNNPRFGTHHTEATKQKMRKARR